MKDFITKLLVTTRQNLLTKRNEALLGNKDKEAQKLANAAGKLADALNWLYEVEYEKGV